MIAKIKGIVIDIEGHDLIIETAGLGYLVHCTSKAMACANLGQEITLHIEMIVRDDQIALYGFESKEEKNCFKLLSSIQGVGSKVAIAILNYLTPAQLTNAIMTQDKNAFHAISGIGPKLATRIINELKDSKQLSKSPAAFIPDTNASNISEEAVQALVNFGFNKNQVRHVIQAILNEEPSTSVDSLIKIGLQRLSNF